MDDAAGVYESTDGGGHWRKRLKKRTVDPIAVAAGGRIAYAGVGVGSVTVGGVGGYAGPPLGVYPADCSTRKTSVSGSTPSCAIASAASWVCM
jgi:hypothetical protein